MTTEDLADGALLIQNLDQRGFPVSAAFWAYDPILELWRLVIAAPPKSIDSLLSAYRIAQDIINDNDLAISLNRISFISDNDPKVSNLRALAQSGTHDVIEAPVGPTEIDGRILDDIHLYRLEALRYEQKVFEALQRVQPPKAMLRYAHRVDLPGRLDTDFLVDNGKTLVAIEAKLWSRPVGSKIVWSSEHLQRRLEDHFKRSTGIVIVSGTGFTDAAIESAAQYPFMRLVRWASSEDDGELRRALVALLD